MLYIVPKMAGTMDRRRNASKRRGVSVSSREFGGINGSEECMMREVGRCRDC